MCLALPARVAQLHEDGTATVELGGIHQRVSLALVDDVAMNDYVIIHVGYALTRLDADEAQRTLMELAQLRGEDAA